MKVRQGFVSNSSTTSFCIYGAYVSTKGTDIDDLYELAEDNGLDCHCGEDGENCVGISWDCIGDDQTGKQFKEYVEATIEKMMGKKYECHTIEEAYYNG